MHNVSTKPCFSPASAPPIKWTSASSSAPLFFFFLLSEQDAQTFKEEDNWPCDFLRHFLMDQIAATPDLYSAELCRVKIDETIFTSIHIVRMRAVHDQRVWLDQLTVWQRLPNHRLEQVLPVLQRRHESLHIFRGHAVCHVISERLYQICFSCERVGTKVTLHQRLCC